MRKYLPGFLLAFAFCVSGFASFASAEPVYNPEILAGPEYDVRSVRWGMSVEEVKKSESMKIAEEGVYDEPQNFKSYYVSYANVPCAGSEAYLIYSFYDNRLFSAVYLFFTKEFILEDLYKTCKSILGKNNQKNILKSTKETVFKWNTAKTKAYLVSKPDKDEDGEYHTSLSFYNASAVAKDKYDE